MATMAEVARRAGVSTATVSRVLNGRSDVNEELAGRVRTAVKELAYNPSRVARSLRMQQSSVWAVIISDVRNPFFTELIPGVEDVAYAEGHSVVLCNARDDLARESDYLKLAVADLMAGVILSPASAEHTDVTPLLERGIPIVSVDRRMRDVVIDHVLVDNAHGAALATEHLIAGSFQRVGCITGPLDTTTGADRRAGYLRALRAHGIASRPDLIQSADFHEVGGYEAAQRLLTLKRPPDAVFVANNLMTVGALRAIRDAGLSVPDDIGVVGFDDPSWAPLLDPPLTTVAQPNYDIGQEAARLLLSRMRGYTGAAREVVLTPTLRVRASSVRAPR